MQTADALRWPLAEFGIVALQEIANVAGLGAALEDPDSRLPEAVRGLAAQAFAPPMEDFSAWLGLVPRQPSKGGKPRLGKAPKMGPPDPGRRLVSRAIANIRWAERRGDRRSLAGGDAKRKPRMIVVVLANKTARKI